jgi:hypothetical protein
VIVLGLATARLGGKATRNRILLARGAWAAEACVAITQARWHSHRFEPAPTAFDLGRRTWCRWTTEDPSALLDVNAADEDELRALLCPGECKQSPMVDSVFARRRNRLFRSVEELRPLPGADSTALRFLTADGPGTVNVNAAPGEVLAVLQGMTPEAVEQVLSRRALGRPIANADELAALLSATAREVLLDHYAEFVRQTTFAAPQLRILTTGWVGEPEGEDHPLQATIELLVVPLPDRLAVVRRRMW